MVCSKGQSDCGGLGPSGEEDDSFVDELLVRGDYMALCGSGGAEKGVEHRLLFAVGGGEKVLHDIFTGLHLSVRRGEWMW